MKENLLDKLEREQIKIASFQKRILAFLIDDLIISCIVLAIFYDKLTNAKNTFEIVDIIGNFSLGIVLLNFIYHTLFTYLYGASLGKIFCKILILNEEFLDKPSFTQSMIRAIIRQLSIMAFYLGFFWALGNDLRKTWQDYTARTIVIDVA